MNQKYLLVGHRGARYALPAAAVREIVWLPALTPLAELPGHIAGVFDLRGRVVPVLDLGVRLGTDPRPPAAGDQVVVLVREPGCIGLLVDDPQDVVSLEDDAFEPAERYQIPGGRIWFVRGALKLDGELVMRLDMDALLQEAPDAAPPAPPAGPPGDVELMARRARELARVPDGAARGERREHALLRLGGELYGLEVAAVAEFARLGSVVPLPGSAPHVAGHMNLRGEILTLIDPRPMMGLSSLPPCADVVVIRRGELRFGFLAEDVEDLVGIDPAGVSPPPAAGRQGAAAFCRGVARVGDHLLSLLDLDGLLNAPPLAMAAAP